MNQLERIAAMEAAYDRASAAMAAGKFAEDDLRVLAAYMDSGDWLRDYEADEAGLIPQDLKRGVLSQDGLYNLITDWEGRQSESAIRPMKLDDYDALYALWLATPGMGLNTTDDSREGIARYLRRNPHTCFVAEADGQLTGAIMAGHDGRRGYIYHTCVREDCRRTGLGRALVERALDALRAEDIHKVALVVFDRNEDGNAFWERMGFTCREDLVYRNRSLTALERIDT